MVTFTMTVQKGIHVYVNENENYQFMIDFFDGFIYTSSIEMCTDLFVTVHIAQKGGQHAAAKNE